MKIRLRMLVPASWGQQRSGLDDTKSYLNARYHEQEPKYIPNPTSS